ncbi:TPA: 50S ribosomal protein L30e [Candidatus Micrarchaeota archaeon]|nr:50S ribosomal protein L30e [Candidatus Micrarchaeota archaeon]
MNIGPSIRLAVDSGKVELGLDRALKSAINGGAKLIVIASNCPRAVELKQYCAASKTPAVEFEGSGVDLGAVCGKPFSISVLTVFEEGNSDILKAVKS